MPQFHPYADAFPMMEGEAFAELIADIKANGLQDPIVMLDGMILDGRNRWKACQQLGIPHREKKFAGEDARAYVWSKNAVRRQLTVSQKAMAAEQLATAKSGGYHDVSRRSENDHDELSTRETAEMSGISRTSVERARRIRKDAIPAVADAVRAGELRLAPADRLSRMPKAEQERVMRETPVDRIPAVVPPVSPVVRQNGTGSRAQPGPRFSMLKNMNDSGVTILQPLYIKWHENRKEIASLPADELEKFVKDLESAARAAHKLIKLIKIESGSVSE